MNEPTIGRLQHTDGIPYFQASRAVAQDNELTLEARGMHSLLLSMPHGCPDPPLTTALRFGAGASVERCQELLDELDAAGYIYLPEATQ